MGDWPYSLHDSHVAEAWLKASLKNRECGIVSCPVVQARRVFALSKIWPALIGG